MSQNLFSKLILLLVVLGAAGAGVYAYTRKSADAESAYLTETLSRGDIVEAVSANGTLNPVVLVSVGTQVSGTAVKVYADFNDTVQAGQVLLELDPAAYEARVRQARAALESAQASLDLARANEARSRDLFEKGYVARQDLDQSRQALKSAQAQVEQTRAQMEDAEVDLRNSVIRSPVSGVVVARTVEEGQTVAASFQTPELFKIAGDLRQMLIHTTFAEADIGRVQPGQMARFTVDAFPDRSFEGRVRQVRLNPTTTQNVVTYDVVVDVRNEDLSLLPGMTAYVSVELSHVADVLRVPNSALRYRPQNADQIAQAGAAAAGGTGAAPRAGSGSGESARAPRAAGEGSGGRGPRAGGRRGSGGATVYVLRDGQLQAVSVSPGTTDGRYTQIESRGDEGLREGDVVVVGDRVNKAPTQQQPMRMRMF